jgi:hypothetical protein
VILVYGFLNRETMKVGLPVTKMIQKPHIMIWTSDFILFGIYRMDGTMDRLNSQYYIYEMDKIKSNIVIIFMKKDGQFLLFIYV